MQASDSSTRLFGLRRPTGRFPVATAPPAKARRDCPRGPVLKRATMPPISESRAADSSVFDRLRRWLSVLFPARVRTLAGLFFLAGTAAVVESAAPAPPPPLTLRIVEERLEGFTPPKRAYVTAGTNEFAFLVPEGFRLELKDGRALYLTSPDQLSVISVRMIETVIRKPLTEESCRNLALAAHAGATVEESFARGAGDAVGPAFLMSRKGAGGLPQQVLMVFIPSGIGVMEFTLVTPAERFETARHALGQVMGSFASAPRGQLKVRPLSNQL